MRTFDPVSPTVGLYKEKSGLRILVILQCLKIDSKNIKTWKPRCPCAKSNMTEPASDSSNMIVVKGLYKTQYIYSKNIYQLF